MFLAHWTWPLCQTATIIYAKDDTTESHDNETSAAIISDHPRGLSITMSLRTFHLESKTTRGSSDICLDGLLPSSTAIEVTPSTVPTSQYKELKVSCRITEQSFFLGESYVSCELVLNVLPTPYRCFHMTSCYINISATLLSHSAPTFGPNCSCQMCGHLVF